MSRNAPPPPAARAPTHPDLEVFFKGIEENINSDPDGALSGLRAGQRLVLRIRVEIGASGQGASRTAGQSPAAGGSSRDSGMEWDLHFWRGAPSPAQRFLVRSATAERKVDSTLIFQSIDILRALSRGEGDSPPTLFRQGKLKMQGNRMALFRLRGIFQGRANAHTGGGTAWPRQVVPKHQWAPDSKASVCGECKKEFTLLRRRHHCRFCGQIYCKSCVARNPNVRGLLACLPCRRAAGGLVAQGRGAQPGAGAAGVNPKVAEEVDELRETIRMVREDGEKQDRLLNKLLLSGDPGVAETLGWWTLPLLVVPALAISTRMLIFSSGLPWIVVAIFVVMEALGVGLAVSPQDAPWRRAALVMLVFFKTAFRYKLTQFRAQTLPDEFSDALYELSHRITAEEVYRTILTTQGMFIKLGQAMSGRADILPTAFIKQLKKLQDGLKADAKDHVIETLEAELKRPVDEVFSEFEYDAIASASIAQVHKATLRRTGQVVAVKLQHKGVEDVMRLDAKIIHVLFTLTGWAFPKQKGIFDAIIEFVKRMEPELDFTQEATSLEEAHVAIGSAGPSLSKRVEVPRPVPGLVTRRVLVMNFIEAIRMPNTETDPSLDKIQRQDVAEAMVAAFANLMLVKGSFMCDPHPGNFLVKPKALHKTAGRRPRALRPQARRLRGRTVAGGSTRANLASVSNHQRSRSERIPPALESKARGRMDVAEPLEWKSGSELVILDFGMSAKLTETARIGFCRLVLAIREGNVSAMLAALSQIGMKLAQLSDQDRENVMTFMTHFYRDTAPAAENRAAFIKFIKEARKRRDAMKAEGKETKNGMTLFEKVPVDWLYYNRTYSLLRGVCCQLGARVPVLDIFCEAAERGLRGAPLAVHVPPQPTPDPPRPKIKSVFYAWIILAAVSAAMLAVYVRKGSEAVGGVLGQSMLAT